MDKQYLDDGGRIYHFNTMDGKKVAYSLSGALEVQVKKLTAETVRARLDLCEEYQVALSLKRIVDDHIKRLRLKDLKPHFNLHWTDTAPLHDPAGVYWTGHVRLINAAIIPKTFSGGSELEHFTSQDGYQVGIGWEWTAKLVDTSAARLLSGNHNTEAIEAVVKQTLAEWVSLTPLSNLIEAVAGPKVFERHPITTQLEEDPLLWHISIRLTPKIEIVGPEPPETSDPEEEITAAEAEA